MTRPPIRHDIIDCIVRQNHLFVDEIVLFIFVLDLFLNNNTKLCKRKLDLLFTLGLNALRTVIHLLID